MEEKLRLLVKLVITAVISVLFGYVASSKLYHDYGNSNIWVLLDVSTFEDWFHVNCLWYYTLLIFVSGAIGAFWMKNSVCYLKRLYNSFGVGGASWHHYFVIVTSGASIGILSYSIHHQVLAKWCCFRGDALILVALVMVYTAYLSHSPRGDVDSTGKMPLSPDIVGVSTLVEYICRKISDGLENHDTPLPKTLAISGNRGSGKSYVIKQVEVKLAKEYGFNSKTFIPWNYDSHTLLYEEVMMAIFNTLEQKYVIPKPRALINTYIGAFCEGPKNVVKTFFGHIFQDYSAEKRTLQDAVMWIENIDKLVLVFDDLDRCNQSELRHVFRLIDRLSIYRNIYVVASIDAKTVAKISRFENRIEIPVKVTA